jgi:hypothetical protein
MLNSIRCRTGPRTIDSNELAAEGLSPLQGIMDSATLPQEIRVEGTDDDPGMIWPLLVELEEVLSIQRDNGAPLTPREVEDLSIRHGSPRQAGLLHGQHIVAETA